MNLHEYQAKQLMARHGVKMPHGEPVATIEEARTAIEKLFSKFFLSVLTLEFPATEKSDDLKLSLSLLNNPMLTPYLLSC